MQSLDLLGQINIRESESSRPSIVPFKSSKFYSRIRQEES